MRKTRFSNCQDAKMYNEGYEQGRADEQLESIEQAKEQAHECIMAIDKARADEREEVNKVFKWLMRMDIINCDECDYQSECINRNMNCFEIMTEHFLERNDIWKKH